jgi:hypothetical protein
MEVPLGPLWVFLVYGERPDAFTLAGGAALLAGLALHEYAAARDARDATRAAPPPDAKELVPRGGPAC